MSGITVMDDNFGEAAEAPLFRGVKVPETLESVTTLVDMLAYRAAHTPDKEAFIYEGEAVSHRRLWNEVGRVGATLRRLGVNPGDRVLVIVPNGAEFFPAFYGAQRAGAIAVPIFPGSGPRRVLSILAACEAKAMLVPSDLPAEALEGFRHDAASFGCAVSTLAECLGSEPTADFPSVEPGDLAFLQYTSGSTGSSKGVMLTHANLVANLRQMVEASLMNEADVLVSWLPVYHDLGLILMTMAPFYIGARLVLLPTSLTKMSRWVAAIATYGGTYTAAPDVGYRQLIKQVRDPEKYDLSTLRIAINAAEPVRASTVEAFERMFSVPGISKPSYGLAEASVGVTFWGVERKSIKVDDRGNVAIGREIPRMEVKIATGDREAATGEVGELVLRSPSATRGYYRNPEATDALFWGDGFVRTGDLAYRDAEGDLFVVARQKNIIKHNGRTVTPREVEELVDDVPGVRYSAAVGINRGDLAGEQLYVFAETRLSPESAATDGPQMVRGIVRLLHQRLGLRPGRVVLTARQTIPFTYNGKIRHAELKESYRSGDLMREGKILYPPAAGTAEP